MFPFPGKKGGTQQKTYLLGTVAELVSDLDSALFLIMFTVCDRDSCPVL